MREWRYSQAMSDQLTETSVSVMDVDSGAPGVPTDQETTEAVLRMGYVRIGRHELQDLKTIGAYVCEAGVLNITRAKALVHQQRLGTAIQEMLATIVELREKPKKSRSDLAAMAQLYQALSRVSAQVTASQQLLLDIEKMSSTAQIEKPRATVKSFAPGAIVHPPAPSGIGNFHPRPRLHGGTA
jgi:hypothetical protein